MDRTSLEDEKRQLEQELLRINIQKLRREEATADSESRRPFWSQSWPRITAVVTVLITAIAAYREWSSNASDERQRWNELFQQFISLSTDGNASKQAAGISGLTNMWHHSERDDHVAAELLGTLLLSNSELVSGAAASGIGVSNSRGSSGPKRSCDPQLTALLFGKSGDWGVVTRVSHMLADTPRRVPVPTRDFGCLVKSAPEVAAHDCLARLHVRPHRMQYQQLPSADQARELHLDAVREAVHHGSECLRDANLRGFDLRGIALYNADLRGANMQDVDLCGATLWNSNLRYAWGLDPAQTSVAKTSLALTNLAVASTTLPLGVLENALTRCHAVLMYDFDQFYRWAEQGYDLPADEKWNEWRTAGFPVEADGSIASRFK